ncbi:LLM class flavin-dependent oxidoreductase [Cryptosporangium aurantiacum]|uniref:Flavin-dependent oxidoreductase, luciferase family (Includes alkanesulfonate monooxygenase SsuD and methylene tetrahydromethanopterin reductase) n=1 Tax=Cryptosporangium aurantiacum TaxID=134849 RepID=A0A1M7RPA6_9ACTN|nr:LLM class flavin-dependent oxidoreductase [Cryptosporangium aurantiacum]SHN47936.1 Flavin-dependent oxidoreductase, luciferase family (includes alkanesulfonate monooxygenase SsuD and methylene tetrahydromethanopterin reductase) [Cryptosporangium aurantiacum]
MNPLIDSPNKLKLGLFGTNGGATLTRVPEVWRPHWDRIVEVAKIADQAGLEASLGYARWKGYVPGMPEAGVAQVVDPFTWAAGLSQVTSYTTHIATVHGSVMHPVLAAKQCTTIDLMSGGRFALNIVGGWNAIELDMFGVGLREHEARYAELEEWVQILTKLWTEKEEFDYTGEFYEVKGGLSRPQPLQKPYLPIINAGSSPRGMDYATTYADVCFTVPDAIGSDAKAKVDELKSTARAKGREVGVWTYCAVVQRDSRAEAEEYLEYFTGPMAENELLDAWQAAALSASVTSNIPEEVIRSMRQRFAAGSGGPILVGTASDIADQLEEISEIGLDGVLLTWPDFTDGVKRLVAPGSVLTELEKRGLREPFRGVQA